MTPEQLKRVAAVFRQACKLPENQREPFIAAACDQDPTIEREVKELLQRSDPTQRLSELQGLVGEFFRRPMEATASFRPGDRIGPYRLTGLLGEGGMGVVYEAEQQHPKRPVALKVIRGGRFVDEHYLRLFQREAQALARLRHPNIAMIYEAGHTEDGQHFFAMELVRGVALKAYVHQHGIDRATRLRLFQKVCDAINYAHQRGVIHRDLKPSNVIIDNDGHPKILDFGLAKITDVDIAASTLVTDLGRVQGTLAYMSPEQARGNPDEIDLRSDVYSLGVMLYELLTQQFPYDLGHTALHVTVRTICETPPRRPRLLDRTLRRDLETILLKTLAKEPARRYQSAAALGEDIERYLNHEPIQARPPSALYQLQRLIGRHKVGFSMLAGLFLTVAGFGLWMQHLYHKEQELRRAAVGNLRRAEQVEELLVELFNSANPEERQDGEVTARGMLESGARRVRTQLSKQPQSHLVFLAPVIARAYLNLGLGDRAAELYQQILEIRLQTLGPDHALTAESYYRLGWALKQNSNFVEAKRNLRRALELQRKSADSEFANISDTQLVLACTLLESGELDEAQTMVQEALAHQDQWPADQRHTLSEYFETHGRVLYELGEYERAEEALREALRIRHEVLSEDHPDIASALERLVPVLQARGRYEEALKRVEEALTLLRGRAYEENHPYIASLIRRQGELKRDQGDTVEAQRLVQTALGTLERRRRADHAWLADPRTTLAWLAFERGDFPQAEKQFHDVVSTYEAKLSANRTVVRSARLGLAESLLAQNNLSGAETLLRGLLENPVLHKTWEHAWATVALSRCLARQGQCSESLPISARGFEGMCALRGIDDRYVVEAGERIMELLESCGEIGEAAEWRAKLASGTSGAPAP